MAKADVIAEALTKLESVSTDYQMLLDVLADVAGDRMPSWVYLVSKHFEPIEGAIDLMGKVVREEALPRLRDMDRFNGGMGVVHPHGDRVPAGQLATARQ